MIEVNDIEYCKLCDGDNSDSEVLRKESDSVWYDEREGVCDSESCEGEGDSYDIHI